MRGRKLPALLYLQIAGTVSATTRWLQSWPLPKLDPRALPTSSDFR